MAPQAPLEIMPPSLERHRRGNTGIHFVTTLDSVRPGPHVMLSALVHGNELCGAVVLDQLLRNPSSPPRGQLTLAFVNVAAYARFDPRVPLASRYIDDDFNRLWQLELLTGQRVSVELARARALRPLVKRIDYLLDIHSMQAAAPPLLLSGALAKGLEMARAVGFPGHIVSDDGHAAGARLRDFGDPASPRSALLVECGHHFAVASIGVAWETVRRFLDHLGMLPPSWAEGWERTPWVPQQVLRVTEAVTVATAAFEFTTSYRSMECVPHAGIVIARDGAREIRTPYDNCVLVLPTVRLQPGLTAARLARLVPT